VLDPKTSDPHGGAWSYDRTLVLSFRVANAASETGRAFILECLSLGLFVGGYSAIHGLVMLHDFLVVNELIVGGVDRSLNLIA
jgi:hypothetical protein